MGIFSKKKEKRELILVFDIGSSSVGGAIFEAQKKEIPKIIFSTREPIFFEDKVETDRFLSLTGKALEVVSSKICLAGIGKPSKIFCVLSSPWYASQTRVIKLEKNVPFLFTLKLANNLIQKEIALFEEENLLKFSDTSDKVRPIEFKNIKTTLNGYTVSNPFNKKAKKLEMVIFVSMSGDQILKKMEEIIFRHFHSKNVRFLSFAMTSFAVARDMFAQHKDFLLADIAGEMTDISLIKNEVINNSFSYPLGCSFMVRGIAKKFGCSLSEAKSFFSLYKDGHAEKSIEKKLEVVINKLKNEWLKNFQEALINLSENVFIPSTILITVDEDLVDFFSEIIKTEQFSQHIFTKSKFRIIFLDNRIFHGIVSFEDNIISRDPFLSLESIYINRFIC